MLRGNHHPREKGVSLLVGTLSFVFIIPLIGLVVDLGVLFAAKARLQGAVDGASLAAARALNLGQTTAAQASSAQQNAVNWFYANFPAGNWGTTGTQMSSSTVQVFDDPNNPHVRDVTVAASTNVPTYFMGWFHVFSTTINAAGNASRRDVVVMMVLDRSGSMGAVCGTLISAAKLFTGQFANGRDRIGLVSFNDNVYDSPPTTNFQTTLGYSNQSGSATGLIDAISCSGNTGTAQAISVAYNEIYKQNLPGALNVMMFETDGLPNTITVNFWDSVNSVAGIKNGSTCKDKNAKTISTGGFANAAALPTTWGGAHAFGSGSLLTDIPAQGMVGAVGSDDPGSTGFSVTFQYWSNTQNNGGSWLSGTGCAFDTTHSPGNATPDFAWFPATDVYGNQLNPASNPYQAVIMTGSHVKSGSWANYHAAALNAADNAAYQARANTTIPVYFFGIGLGGNGANPPDYILMQRMANDPNGDNYNSPAKYLPCAQESSCVNYASQPQGTFIFSANASALSQAFLAISSQVLRLSK
jgi:Flp pilus assembly protein TadG